jgi:predicted phosphoribosyltransferase
VVLGIPRGGLIVALELSRILKCRLDIALSRKLGAPHNPELAIGAINESGKVFIDEDIAAHLGVDAAYIKEQAMTQSAEIARRSGVFRSILPKAGLKDMTVIVADDGLATGATMQASLFTARSERPARLIAAVPVASEEAINRIAGYCDEILCLRVPEFFAAVGQFYKNFEQTTDEEVIAILKEEAKHN